MKKNIDEILKLKLLNHQKYFKLNIENIINKEFKNLCNDLMININQLIKTLEKKNISKYDIQKMFEFEKELSQIKVLIINYNKN